MGRLRGGSSRWSCAVWSNCRLLSQRICSRTACQRPGVGGALLRVGRWNMRFCSGVWRCRQAHAGSPSPLALVREAIPRRRPAPLRQGHLRRPA